MQLVLAVLLALPIPSAPAGGFSLPTPAQQQRAAGSVYRVNYAVTAYGWFVTVKDDEFAIITTSDDRYGMAGAAFAVDADGWLLTARHVVDTEAAVPDICAKLTKRYTKAQVTSIRMDMVLEDIVGNIWPARFTVTAPDDEDVCAADSLRVDRESFWPVSVEKMDDVADLALLKLTQAHGPVVALPFGTMASLHEWHAVYAFGFPGKGRGTMKMINGMLARPCEERITSSPSELGPDIVRVDIELLSRYVMEGRPGFSGGPVVAGDALAGITVAAGPTESDPERGISSIGLTFAVPVDYVQAWYLWARGLSKEKPTTVCEPPLEFEGSYAPSR